MPNGLTLREHPSGIREEKTMSVRKSRGRVNNGRVPGHKAESATTSDKASITLFNSDDASRVAKSNGKAAGATNGGNPKQKKSTLVKVPELLDDNRVTNGKPKPAKKELPQEEDLDEEDDEDEEDDDEEEGIDEDEDEE
jgi:hypothetical protein